MRITIETDADGKVKVDTGEFATDVPAIDAGPAPIEHIKRLSAAAVAVDAGAPTATIARRIPDTELPLNPLRAGAAAALQATSGDVGSREESSDGGEAPRDPAGILAAEKAPATPERKPARSNRRKK